jgi:WD40 repeat protein
MLKRILFILVGLAFLMTSCQTGQIPGATDIARIPTRTEQASLPTKTLPIGPSFTLTPEIEAASIKTALPVSTGTLPRCFVSSTEYDPFAFMPDSIRILIKERSGVRLFNLQTLQEEYLFQAPQDLVAVALSPDGEVLAWSLGDYSIQLIRVIDGKLINTMKAHTLPVMKLRFSATGDRLFSASMDSWVRMWDRNGKLLDAFQPTGADNLPNDIEGIGISGDDMMFGSIPFDGPTRVWDLSTHKELVNLGGTGGDVTSNIAFSPDGQFVAANPISRLSLWRVSDWKKIWSGVSSMAFAFSPDGRYLAYTDMDDDQSVTLRSLPAIDETSTFEKDHATIYDLFFSPDGALLASAGAGIRIWQVETGQLAYIGKAACP